MQILYCKFVMLLLLSCICDFKIWWLRIYRCCCDFCNKQGNSTERCPTLKFKVSSEKLFRRSAIIVEAKERLPNDFWDFIPEDEQQEESNLKPNKRFLSHAQVTWSSYTYVKICILFNFKKTRPKMTPIYITPYLPQHLLSFQVIITFTNHSLFSSLTLYSELLNCLIWFCSNCCHN